MFNFFRRHRHHWGYATGTMPGILSGKVRPLCVTRECKSCGLREEIMCYRAGFYGSDGTYFVYAPEWTTVPTTKPASRAGENDA